MTGEYNITLTNGNTLAVLHPLEVNGPDNLSIPRFVQQARPAYPVVVVTPGSSLISILGDETDTFRVGFIFTYVDSTGNDGNYTVNSVSFTAGNTVIETVEVFADPTPDGLLLAHIFKLAGDVTSRFIPAFSFDVINSAEIDGTYIIDAIDTIFDGVNTIIPVGNGNIRDQVSNPIALPLGEIQYINVDANTSLKLPGKGFINYGEALIENMVRMTEHFAADVSPDLNAVIGTTPAADPLIGQLWYRTLVGEEGFLHFDGVQWTSDYDVGTGSVIFTDVENANADIFVTGSETNLPAPWPGASNLPGLVVWNQSDPASAEPIFRVLSENGSERLRVDHDGLLLTSNDLQVQGLNSSTFYGSVAIGGNGAPVQANTLTVEGNGISVNSDTGLDANLNLNAPLTQESVINFNIAGTTHGNISVDDNIAGNPLEINSTVANNVVMVQGGGNVGIDTSTAPTAVLQVRSNIFFDEGDGDVSVGADIRTASSGLLAADQSLHINYDALGATGQSLDFRSGTANSAGTLRARLNDTSFTVDTDTLYVDTTNDRVGINAAPLYPFDVTGDARFNGFVGINNVPPSGAVRLEVTGDIQVNSQVRGSNQTVASPTYTFTSDLTTGMYKSTGLGFSVGGASILDVQSTVIVANATLSGSTYTFNGDTSTYINTSAVGELVLNAVTDISFQIGAVDKLILKSDGTFSVNTASYENLVLAANDIPNKAYVDASSGAPPSYEEYVGVGGETIVNTTVSTVAKTATTATLQVFLNGLFQQEGASKAYTVTGANQITFNAALVLNDDVIFYVFA